MNGSITSRRRAAGFTLVESLVAMIVISVGMLGIAAMYVEGLRTGRTSIYRSVAVDLAADLADRMRANSLGRAAYGGTPAGSGTGCVNAGSDLSPASQAACDLYFWQQQVGSLLPAGTATVAYAAAGGTAGNYTITVNWNEPGVTGSMRYALAVQL